MHLNLLITVDTVEGPVFNITKVNRLHMGVFFIFTHLNIYIIWRLLFYFLYDVQAYLCIANNGK